MQMSRLLMGLLDAFDKTMLGLGVVLPAYLVYDNQAILGLKVFVLWLVTYGGSKYLIWKYHPDSPRHDSPE